MAGVAMAKSKSKNQPSTEIIDHLKHLFNTCCFRSHVPDKIKEAAFSFLCKRKIMSVDKGRVYLCNNGKYEELLPQPNTNQEYILCEKQLVESLLTVTFNDNVELILSRSFRDLLFSHYPPYRRRPLRRAGLFNAECRLNYDEDILERIEAYKIDIRQDFHDHEKPEADALIEYALIRAKADVVKSQAELQYIKYNRTTPRSTLDRDLPDVNLHEKAEATPADAPFCNDILTDLQLSIMDELQSEGLTADILSIKLGKSVDAIKVALRELMKTGKVKNKRGLGYYRPDCPPRPSTNEE